MSTAETHPVRLVVITGLSGSGKSLALRALEDASYYCVDNLPVDLIPTFHDLCLRGGRAKVALVLDVRGGEGLRLLPRTLADLRARGGPVKGLGEIGLLGDDVFQSSIDDPLFPLKVSGDIHLFSQVYSSPVASSGSNGPCAKSPPFPLTSTSTFFRASFSF